MPDKQGGVTRQKVPHGEYLRMRAGGMAKFAYREGAWDYYDVKAVPKSVRIRTKRRRIDTKPSEGV